MPLSPMDEFNLLSFGSIPEKEYFADGYHSLNEVIDKYFPEHRDAWSTCQGQGHTLPEDAINRERVTFEIA